MLDPGGQIVASARFYDDNPAEIEGFYFYHYDMRGSTTDIVAPNGSMKTGYEYDEFGSLEQSGDKTFLNDVTYTGSVTDKSTGLQYMNARFYNPSNGRFLSQDTYTGNAYDPWTQHLYAYTGNNPVNFIDPTGHSSKSLAELRSDLKFRQKLVAGYTRLVQNCNDASMLDLYIYGRERNKGIVMDLKAEIAKLITKDLSDTQREEVMATIEEAGWDNVEIGDEGMSVYTGGTSVMCVLTPEGAKDYMKALDDLSRNIDLSGSVLEGAGGISAIAGGMAAGGVFGSGAAATALAGLASNPVGWVIAGAVIVVGFEFKLVSNGIEQHLSDLGHYNDIADKKGAVFSATFYPSSLTGIGVKFGYPN